MKSKHILRSLLTTLLLAAPLARGSIITDGLVGYWPGDGNANDLSLTANNGTFTGSYAPGIFGSAFNLQDANVTIPDIADYSFASDVTVAFWFNRNGFGGGSFIGQDVGPGSQLKWFVDYGYVGNYLELVVHAPPTAFLHSTPFIFPDGWNHAALVKSGSLYSFCLNGSTIGTQTSSAPFPDPPAALKFGYAEAPVPAFRGIMDDVVLYDRALSSSEIATIAMPEPTSAGLLFVGVMLLSLRRQRDRMSRV